VKRRAGELTVLLLLQRFSSDVAGNFFQAKYLHGAEAGELFRRRPLFFIWKSSSCSTRSRCAAAVAVVPQREKHFTLTKFGTISSKVVVLFVI
jgi:hypothetical protein